jgi:DNA helicase II / ATP-dependent DNA helicase PcrA
MNYELQVDERLLHATEEQALIIDLALSSQENILINALAGAAKTSTLRFLCKYLPMQPILSLAFNKRIAEEMTRVLPGHVKAQTLNGVCHRVWMQVCSKKIYLDTKKSYNILKGIVDGLSRADKSEAYETFSDTLKLVSKAKAAGYIPDGVMPHATRLISCDKFWNSQAEEDEELLSSRVMVDTVLTESIRQAYNGTIDFDDQIYMSTLFGGTFPQFPLVMVDEAQDLSSLNHAMLKKLAKGRLIAVGDPWQSIYGFRGAVSQGMSRLKADFNMTEMNLSISFRCPIEVVKSAHSRVPHMRWPEWAKQGEVRKLEEWDAQSIADGAAIICRNNAPLFSLAFKLLQSGRGVSLIGFDIGPSLVKTMKKLGPLTLTQEEVYRAIDEWEEAKLKSAKSEASVRDKADCFRVFASFGKDLATACVFTEDMFKRQGTIQLLSGHKAKGLEWKTVYHLDPWRVPSKYAKSHEEMEQELNVRYVIQTRAKESLFLADLKDFNA